MLQETQIPQSFNHYYFVTVMAFKWFIAVSTLLQMSTCQLFRDMKELPRPFLPLQKLHNLLTLESAPIPYSGPHKPIWGPAEPPVMRVRYTPALPHEILAFGGPLMPTSPPPPPNTSPSLAMTQAILLHQQLPTTTPSSEHWNHPPNQNDLPLKPNNNDTHHHNDNTNNKDSEVVNDIPNMSPPMVSAVSEYAAYNNKRRNKQNKRKKVVHNYRPSASHETPIIINAHPTVNNGQQIPQYHHHHPHQQFHHQQTQNVGHPPIITTQLSVPALIIKTKELTAKPEPAIHQYIPSIASFPPSQGFRPQAPIEFNFPSRGPPLNRRPNNFSPNLEGGFYQQNQQFSTGGLSPNSHLFPSSTFSPHLNFPRVLPQNDWIPIKSPQQQQIPIVKHYHVESGISANEKNAINIKHIQNILNHIEPTSDPHIEIQDSINVYQESSIVPPEELNEQLKSLHDIAGGHQEFTVRQNYQAAHALSQPFHQTNSHVIQHQHHHYQQPQQIHQQLLEQQYQQSQVNENHHHDQHQTIDPRENKSPEIKSTVAKHISQQKHAPTNNSNKEHEFNSKDFLKLKEKSDSNEDTTSKRRSMVIDSEKLKSLVEKRKKFPDVKLNEGNENKNRSKQPEVSASVAKVNVQTSERTQAIESVKKEARTLENNSEPVLIYPETKIENSMITPKTILGNRNKDKENKQSTSSAEIEIIPAIGRVGYQEIIKYY